MSGHEDEILDVVFNIPGTKLATASADGTSRLYDISSIVSSLSAPGSTTKSSKNFDKCKVLQGHDGEISQVCFNSQGTRVLTAGIDKTARLWNVETGECIQTLEGHSDEIFSCAFNYQGDAIITGSKVIFYYLSSKFTYPNNSNFSNSSFRRSLLVENLLVDEKRTIHAGFGNVKAVLL